MIRTVLLLSGVAGLACCSASAQGTKVPKEGKDPQWTALAFHVQKPDANTGKTSGFLRDRDRDLGTRVVARLDVPERAVIALQVKSSKLDSFTDDKGTDLTATVPPPGLRAAPISADYDILDPRPNEIVFRATGCPAKGATKVRIKGTLAVVVGKEMKEIETKNFAVQSGTVDLGFGTLKGSANTKAASTTLTYQGERPVVSVTLLDADEKEIRCSVRSTYQAEAVATKGQYRTTITVTARGVERCTVRIKYCDAVEELKVPVDLEVGPGL